MREQQNLAAKFECLSWRRAASFDSSTIVDTTIRRQLGRIVQPGRCGLGEDKYAEVMQLLTDYPIIRTQLISDNTCYFADERKL